MKEKWIKAHMDAAIRYSQLSYAIRLKVGSVVVKDDKIISIGYNGTPAGWDNNCEDKIYMDQGDDGWLNPEEIEEIWPFEDNLGRYKLVTKPEVLHAEENAIIKLAKTNGNADYAMMFSTHTPCIHCAKLIHGSGIRTLYYKDVYRSEEGIDFLKKCGIKIVKHG